MKIAFIGTYPPRQCGIGTFTNNLVKAVDNDRENKSLVSRSMVIAINDVSNGYKYPEEVKKTIQEDSLPDYIDAAKFINYSDAKVCVLEHEFGIFGGNDGAYILPLLHKLNIPIIVTFHTILKYPSYTQKLVIQEIGKEVSRIVVMSNLAVKFLVEIYNIPKEKIVIIEHGVPDYEHISREEAKAKHGLSDLKVLFTFGLLSRNKGIETVINALPRVVEKYPNVLYLILGATHPNVLKYSGDEYRYELKRLVKSNGLEKNVYFKNEFATEKELMEYLQTSDIYISPYLSESQITSGTLSYAVGTGCAVLSTPYWHAQELLADGRGRLFDFKDSDQLADLLLDLLNHPDKLETLRRNAYSYGEKIRWSNAGRRYLDLAEDVLRKWAKKEILDKHAIDLQLLPPFSLDHIERMTDDTGIIQHARYGIPNLKKGYCVDDNSRALLMLTMAYRQNRNKSILKLMPVYLSFIDYMQLSNGDFRNFLSFNRQFLDEHGSEDSFGRTVWALGYLIRFSPNDSFKQLGKDIFFKSVQHFSTIKTIRGAADTILGIYNYLKNVPGDEGMINEMNKLVKIIVESYKEHANENWKWFEANMTYDNAIIPLSLFVAYEITNDAEVYKIANEAAEFLESKTMQRGFLMPIGNDGWLQEGSEVPEYDQQSIDVMAMVLMYFQLFYLTKEHIYMEKMFNCYLWFHGKNILRLPLYDHETKGCCDGLKKEGLNRNQGAESTLSYLISHLAILLAQEKDIF